MLRQVIEIEPENEDAYIGCCELLKADGKNLEAVAVYCKYVQVSAAQSASRTIAHNSCRKLHALVVAAAAAISMCC